MMFFGAIFGSEQCIGLYTLYQRKTTYSFSGGCSTPFYGAYGAINVDAGLFYLDDSVFQHNTVKDIHAYLTTPFGNSLYGDSVRFALSGNTSQQIDSFSLKLYNPTKIELYAPTGKTISKASNINLTWNADPNSKGVYIHIRYEGGYTHLEDSTFSDEDIFVNYFTEDDGSFTVPASAMALMPSGGYFEIQVSRGDFAAVSQPNEKFIYVVSGSVDWCHYKLED
jgi:hypothetical protein